ncbi:MAG: hypothetical protein IJ193_03125 [Bacilli bacterium]|nr:hypothetical protein [Bacilli bacterium]
MKKFKDGIFMGIISIISSSFFVGMPVGKNFFEILLLLFFIVGVFVILYLGFSKKDSRNTLLFSVLYSFVLFVLVAFIELEFKDFTLYTVGFLPGLVISTTGFYLSKVNKDQYYTKLSLVLNSIGFIISVLSLLMVIPNGGFVFH